MPVLMEMLDPDELAGVELEQTKALREDKRQAIVSNALRSARLLAEKNPAVDLAPLEPARETAQQHDRRAAKDRSQDRARRTERPAQASRRD